jgi:esterase/lipase
MLPAAGFDHHWVGEPAGLLGHWNMGAAYPNCLLISPFAEEQGRCRRLQYDISANLADHGLGSCWLDLPGTGDSPVDETQITAHMWLLAISAAVSWLKSGDHTLSFVGGLRLGGAVAISWAQMQPPPLYAIAAIEPISGSYALRALLRSRIVQQNSKNTEQLLLDMQAGTVLNVAGYPLAHATRLALEHFTMAEPPTASTHIIRSVLPDMPPWLQAEPLAAPALAADIAAQLLQVSQAISV